MTERVMLEMTETQGYAKFNQKVENGLKAQKEYDFLKEEEHNYMQQIKKVTEDDKNKRDINAREASESTEEISKSRMKLNETKTESHLQIEYTKREIDGKLQTMTRLQNKVETDMRNDIKRLKETLDVEKLVSKKIIDFINRQRDTVQIKSDNREKHRESEVTRLGEDRLKIQQKKEEADEDIKNKQIECEELDEEKKLAQARDDEDAAKENDKLKQKEDMIAASKYIMKKWNWFQTEGKFLAKKRKGKKGGKGKKKKK